VVDMLKVDVSLQSLNLGHSDLGDAGALEIAASLKQNSSLLGLDLQLAAPTSA